MSAVTQLIRDLKARGEAAFMPFIVIGDPDFAQSLRLTEALVEAGADILEFGFPFSDPPADGPVIQAADARALAAGMTPARCFEFLAEAKARWAKPAALLIYFNLVLQMGVEAFYARCAQTGVEAVLVADVPLEEAAAVVAAGRKSGVDTIFIASELTTDERLGQVAEVATGYLYAVARVGITGEQTGVNPALEAQITRFKAAIDLPVLVGFGISSPEHVRAVIASGADGVIVGSAIVRRIEAHLDDPDRMVDAVRTFCATLKEATRC